MFNFFHRFIKMAESVEVVIHKLLSLDNNEFIDVLTTLISAVNNSNHIVEIRKTEITDTINATIALLNNHDNFLEHNVTPNVFRSLTIRYIQATMHEIKSSIKIKDVDLNCLLE